MKQKENRGFTFIYKIEKKKIICNEKKKKKNQNFIKKFIFKINHL